MIVVTWIALAIISSLVQIFLAYKKVSHLVGLVLPAAFLIFAIYAMVTLSRIGIFLTVLMAFMIPPIFLVSLFELVYWRQRWKEKIQYEK